MIVVYSIADPGVRIPLGARPRFIGRGPGNDLVLDDPQVSSKHLSMWVEDGVPCAVDLGSRNGTTLGDEPIAGVVRLAVLDRLTLGGGSTLELAEVQATEEAPGWNLRECESGSTVAILTDRFRIGRDLVVPGLPDDQHVQLLIDGDGFLCREQDDDAIRLATGDVIEVADARWEVREAHDGRPATLVVQRAVYPYRVEVRPAAVRFVHGSSSCDIDAANRYALLVVLARARAKALAAGDVEGGWVDDETLATGIWGARNRARTPRVVLCRTRAELRAAGLDPWCLEKRTGGTRLRVNEIIDLPD